MRPLYDINGLMFWTEREMRLRDRFRDHFVFTLSEALRAINPGFVVLGCEAPILTPEGSINSSYGREDVFFTGGGLALRPETTPGSYVYARRLFDDREFRPPLCVWQCGKSFRREQDQVVKNMRLKEFYQLEFQCVYTEDTANDYHAALLEPTRRMIAETVGSPTRLTVSDRLPDYSQITMDVEVDNGDRWMEVASISRRTDFPGVFAFQGKSGLSEKKLLVAEVAVGLDRCVYNFESRAKSL